MTSHANKRLAVVSAIATYGSSKCGVDPVISTDWSWEGVASHRHQQSSDIPCKQDSCYIVWGCVSGNEYLNAQRMTLSGIRFRLNRAISKWHTCTQQYAPTRACVMSALVCTRIMLSHHLLLYVLNRYSQSTVLVNVLKAITHFRMHCNLIFLCKTKSLQRILMSYMYIETLIITSELILKKWFSLRDIFLTWRKGIRVNTTWPLQNDERPKHEQVRVASWRQHFEYQWRHHVRKHSSLKQDAKFKRFVLQNDVCNSFPWNTSSKFIQKIRTVLSTLNYRVTQVIRVFSSSRNSSHAHF